MRARVFGRLECRLVLVVVAMLGVGCSGPGLFFPRQGQPFERHHAVTDDGVRLMLLRHTPTEGAVKPVPVILAHGIATNALGFDLSPEVSMVKHLVDSGYEVWTFSLAGRWGSGTRPGGSDIDHFIEHDVPAVIDYVRSTSGADEVYWVGWSMGSMIMTAHLQDHPDAPVKGFVSIAGPVILEKPYHGALEFFRDNPTLVTLWLSLSNLRGASFIPQFFPGVVLSDRSLVFNPENITPRVVSMYFSNAVDNATHPTYYQIRRMLATGHFLSRDGKVDYASADRLARLDKPILVLGGADDRICSPRAGRYLYDHVGSRDKTLRIFGADQGDTVDYGHVDICVGINSPSEVYPAITSWLDRRTSP